MRSTAIPAKAGASLALGALLFGASCIALSPIFVRISQTGPTASAFWRVALAVPALWLLVLLEPGRPRRPARALVPLMLAAGAAFAGDLGIWHTSIELTSVADSTLLANLASIFVTLAAWLFWRQQPSRVFLLGLAVALAGVATLVRASAGLSSQALLGDALGVVTALFYAAYLLAVKSLRDRGAATLRLMAVTTTVTAVLLLPAAFATGEPMLPVSAAGWLTLLGLALISQVAGQGLIAFALAHLPAAFSSVSLLFQPVMAAAFAWMLLEEPMSAVQITGSLVVLAGIYLARRGS